MNTINQKLIKKIYDNIGVNIDEVGEGLLILMSNEKSSGIVTKGQNEQISKGIHNILRNEEVFKSILFNAVLNYLNENEEDLKSFINILLSFSVQKNMPKAKDSNVN